jgi:murein DD-endopeptidase MepM/ murein hydrolase activator NlpD
MSDLSVALERIRTLERAVQAPFAGDPAAFLAALSGLLEAAGAGAASAQPLSPAAGSSATDLLLLEGALRARFAAAPGSGNGRLQRPVDGRVSSGFGPRVHPVTGGADHHDGADFAAPEGTPIRAAGAGTVSFAGERNGYGNLVIIDHPGGTQTWYAHQSRMGVAEGERVARGQTIGAVGATGRATGPHLHFEVREGGRAVDPLPLL